MIYFDEIDSTNDELKRRIKSQIINDKTSICAFLQQKGRGRNDRYFLSEKGGIYYSIAIKNPTFCPTILAPIACTRSIKGLFDKKVGIKWVNDIIYNNFKCAGILAEKIYEYVIIGIGVNVYTKIPQELENKAISLFNPNEYDKEKLYSFAETLDKNIDNVFSQSDYPSLVDEYTKNSVLIGKQCILSNIKGETIAQGVVKGFDYSGEILIKNKKDVKKYSCGEISLYCDELYKKCLN